MMESEMKLRDPDAHDLDGVVRVFEAQERAWWDEVDGDADDIQRELDRAVDATGSFAEGVRLSLADDGTIAGVGLHVGHGQTSVVIDPMAPTPERHLDALVTWLLSTGAIEIEAPSHDRVRIAVIKTHGFVASRSSFDLERNGPIDDVADISLPDVVTASPFGQRIDDVEEVHDLVYSVWTDVAGHTYRPIEEWRSLFLSGPSFDPELIVLARRVDDHRLAGVAVCRVFNDEIGWVAQLAVGRDHRGLGLGRALLAEGLRRLSQRGIQRFGLSVEAENATALGLYRNLGFDITREWVHFTTHISVPNP
jgi:GNAT superfamily N-acetyltransferase